MDLPELVPLPPQEAETSSAVTHSFLQEADMKSFCSITSSLLASLQETALSEERETKVCPVRILATICLAGCQRVDVQKVALQRTVTGAAQFLHVFNTAGATLIYIKMWSRRVKNLLQ